MGDERGAPDDPREWIRRARSNLLRARAEAPAGVYLEDLLFDAQQAAEKAIKAIFVLRRPPVLYVHDLRRLLDQLITDGEVVPPGVLAASRLTRFAHEARYPGVSPPVTPDEYVELITVAERVVQWAEARMEGRP